MYGASNFLLAFPHFYPQKYKGSFPAGIFTGFRNGVDSNENGGYCPLVNKGSEKRAPKCLHFSILCADGLLFTPSLHKIVSELVGVNSNENGEGLRRKNTQTGRSMCVYVVR